MVSKRAALVISLYFLFLVVTVVDIFGINVVFVLAVVSVPDLGKERVDLCNFIILPGHRKAIRAPVTASENKVRRHFKLASASALPLNRSVHILRSLLCKAFAASEFGSLLEIGKSELFKGLAFIIAVVKEIFGMFLIGNNDLKVVPGLGNGLIFFL